jgi:hypothetical protein
MNLGVQSSAGKGLVLSLGGGRAQLRTRWTLCGECPGFPAFDKFAIIQCEADQAWSCCCWEIVGHAGCVSARPAGLHANRSF